jgi:hypothetical protein
MSSFDAGSSRQVARAPSRPVAELLHRAYIPAIRERKLWLQLELDATLARYFRSRHLNGIFTVSAKR